MLTKTLFGASIEVMDNLPADTFMIVSRVSEHPTIFHVLHSSGGKLREWRGTLSDALQVVNDSEES